MQLAMYIGFAFSAAAMYLIAIALLFEPTPFVALIPLVVSLVGAAFVRWSLEHTSVNGMFDLKTQSWTFVVGDGMALPIALLMIGFARSEVVIVGFWAQWQWFIMAAVIGLVGGILFRLMDRPRYLKASAGLTLASPTKVWHDFVTYPVLLGAVMWAGVPLLMPEYWVWPTVVAIVALIGWGGLGARDAVRQPSPLAQHPEWDTQAFSVI